MFLNSVNVDGEKRTRNSSKFEDCIKEVGLQNVIQIITGNASACKGAGAIIKCKYPHIFWTSCAVHTLKFALKNICVVKNTEANVITYAQCNWITKVSNDAMMIKKFIMNQIMGLAMLNEYFKMKLLAIAETNLLRRLSC